jgi:hypothetical protein
LVSNFGNGFVCGKEEEREGRDLFVRQAMCYVTQVLGRGMTREAYRHKREREPGESPK